MFENMIKFFKKFGKNGKENSKTTAKERLHLVLAQDRANISADFLDMMKQEIIEVIKKYIDIDEEAIDVRMTNKAGEDGIVGAPALYANIPIVTIKNEARKLEKKMQEKQEENKDDVETEECKQEEENTVESQQIESKVEEPEEKETIEVEEDTEEKVIQQESEETDIKNNEPEKEPKNSENNSVKKENKSKVKKQENEKKRTSK